MEETLTLAMVFEEMLQSPITIRCSEVLKLHVARYTSINSMMSTGPPIQHQVVTSLCLHFLNHHKHTPPIVKQSTKQHQPKHECLTCFQSTHHRLPPYLPRRHDTDHTRALAEPGPEDSIRILEHAIFQTHNNELTALEPCLDQSADILRMREVQCGIDLVENVHRGGLELE